MPFAGNCSESILQKIWRDIFSLSHCLLQDSEMKSMKFLLYSGASYFCLLAIAHALELKIPGLFIYFNVPSYAYQNKIIAFLAFGWAAFFYAAASTLSKSQIRAILISGGFALIMLSVINFRTDFSAMSNNTNPFWFHLQTLLLFFYWISLIFGYKKLGSVTQSSDRLMKS